MFCEWMVFVLEIVVTGSIIEDKKVLQIAFVQWKGWWTLGYYDQDYQSRYNPQKSKGGFFLASLAGAILGGLLVIFSIPALSKFDLLPYQIEPNNQPVVTEDNQSDAEGNNQADTRNVSIDVYSKIIKAVDKAGDAVVGITNIQESTGFWGQNQESGGTGSGVVYKKEGEIGRAHVWTPVTV